MGYIFNSLTSSTLGQTTAKYQVYWDGTYLWTVDASGNVFVSTFNGSTFTIVSAPFSVGSAGVAMHGDGFYVYVSAGGGSIHALHYAAGTITEAGSISGVDISLNGLYCDSHGYLYVNGSVFIKAYLFTGSVFQLKGSFVLDNAGTRVTSDGIHLFFTTWNSITACNFDGNNFVNMVNSGAGGGYEDLLWDGSRLWASNHGSNILRVITFSGGAFSFGSSLALSASALSIATDGQFIYTMENGSRIGIYQLVGGVITLVASIPDTAITATGRNQIAFGGGYGFYATGASDHLLKAIQMQLLAQFNVDHIAGEAPLTVTFTSI